MKNTIELVKKYIKDGLQEIFRSHEELGRLARDSDKWKEFDSKENWKDTEVFRSDAFRILGRIEQFLSQQKMPSGRVDAINEEVYDLLMNRAYYQLILKQESEWIKEKREKVEDEDEECEKLTNDFFGLALSGGGIRSATFNLGFIQALQQYKIFNSIDYLSTVSGGGYIGASQTWLRYVRPDIEFPFDSKREDVGALGGKILAWMRDHGNYLSPGNGLNIWSLIGAFMGSVMVNLLVLTPVLLLSIYLVYLSAPYRIFFLIGIFFIFWYIAKVIIYILCAVGEKRPDFDRQRGERGSIGKIMMFATLFLVIGSISPIYAFLTEHLKGWIGMVSLSTIFAGVVSFASAYRESKKDENKPIGLENLLLSTGITLILYGLVIWLYHLFYLGHSGVELLFPLLISSCFAVLIFSIPKLLKKSVEWALGISLLLLVIAIAVIFVWLQKEASLSGIGIFLLLSLPISALFAAYTKINYVSMHRYYRNRLMEAYFPWCVVNVSDKKADDFYLTQMKKPEKTPYPIINTNVNMVGSGSTRQRKRGGDNFIFSPLFCGSDITGYRSTEHYASGKMNFATAFAISGAAVDPNTYATRSKPISFVMSLLNVRLGYWIENPRKEYGADRIGWSYYLSIFKELFGKGLNEHETYIHLADGGHFENLGLYELVRRKCRHIIVTDAGKDPHFTFGDFAKVIELVRVDFGAEITIDTRLLRPDAKYKVSKTAFIYGTIRYNDGNIGDIIYVKTTVVDGLSEDIYSYRRTNPKFPDQTTADQNFDEMQFEAYRELGYQIGKNLCKNEDQDDYHSIFRGGLL